MVEVGASATVVALHVATAAVVMPAVDHTAGCYDVTGIAETAAAVAAATFGSAGSRKPPAAGSACLQRGSARIGGVADGSARGCFVLATAPSGSAHAALVYKHAEESSDALEWVAAVQPFLAVAERRRPQAETGGSVRLSQQLQSRCVPQ